MRAQWQKNVKFLFQGTPTQSLEHSGTSSLEGPPLHTPPSIPIHNFFTYIPPILFQGLLGHSDTSSLEGPPLHTPSPHPVARGNTRRLLPVCVDIFHLIIYYITTLLLIIYYIATPHDILHHYIVLLLSIYSTCNITASHTSLSPVSINIFFWVEILKGVFCLLLLV